MHPTPAMSPSLNFLTARPVFVTRPMISCPGTQGYTVGIVFCHSLRTWCKSEWRSEEHTSELQSQSNLVCRLLLEKKKTQYVSHSIHFQARPENNPPQGLHLH